MMDKRRMMLAIGILAAAVAGVRLVFFADGPETPVERQSGRSAAKIRATKAANPKLVRKTAEVPGREKAEVSEDERLSDALDEALRKEDFESARKLAMQALASTNADVRTDAVSVLGWFGEEALPELTAFVSDRDETVRREAMGQWRNALAQVEDEKLKERVVGMTVKRLKDPEAMEDVAGEIVKLRDRAAIRILNEMIASGNTKLVAQACETYKFITGKDYTSRQAAEAWLKEAEDVD